MVGSKNVLEFYGFVYRNYCIKCGKFFDLEFMLNLGGNIFYCDNCGFIVKLDVVFYEEVFDSDVIIKIIFVISNVDLLIIGGILLVVYLVVSFIDYYKGDYIVFINKVNIVYDKLVFFVINKFIGEVLYEVVLR